MIEDTIQVLLVEDSPTDALIVREELTESTDATFNVTQVERLGEALQRLQQRRFGVVLLDLSLPDSEGFATFTRLHEAASEVPVIVLSGQADETLAVKAVQSGAQDYLVKGHFEEQVLARAIRYAIERKRSEGALAESERRLREMLENVDLIAMTLGEDGRVTFCNDYLLRLTGYAREEVIGANWFETFVSQLNSQTRTPFFTAGDAVQFRAHHENVLRTKAGVLREIAWNNTTLRDTAGKIVGLASIGEDVTDRKRSEAALRLSEERFREVVENIHEVFWMTDVKKHEMLYVSPGYEAIWGRTRESLYTSPQTWTQSIHPEDRARTAIASAQQQDGGYDETYRISRPDGTLRWIRDRAFPIRDIRGSVHRIVGTAEDISVRKRAELRLSLQHAVTSVLAEAGSSTEINLKILETLGRSLHCELGEMWMTDRPPKVLHCMEIWHAPSSVFQEFALASRPLTFARGEGLPGGIWESGKTEWSLDVASDARSQRRAQSTRLKRFSWIGFPLKIREEFLGVIEFFGTEIPVPDDDTLAMLNELGAQIGIFIERRQLAEQFRQSQKMDAIGTLAGGIAHDFNNVLACINGYTELVKMECAPSSRATEYLDAVLRGTKRATDLVRQILAFSRQQPLERRPIQLRLVVAEALELLRAAIPTTIEFQTELAPDLPNVFADATQVHQIVINLCTNAAHAMKGRPGHLSVKLGMFVIDQALASTMPHLQCGPHVRLSVSDTGCGMDKVTLSRIFEPFFTTKAAGEGTGLGLSVVHGIMQSHEGDLTVYSRPGDGTTFNLYFPPHASPSVAAPLKIVETPRGQNERILYVDDEALLATMVKEILERLDYVVDVCTNAKEALAAVRAKPDAYDLVITDQIMPGLMGTVLAEQIHELRADLPIILTTGYSATLTDDRVQEMGIRRLLLKPLSVLELGSTIRDVLAEAQTIR